MSKTDLSNELANRLNRDVDDVKALLEGFAAMVRSCCGENQTVAMPGFGNFVPRKEDEHIEVDATTNRRMLMPPRVMLHFEPSAILKSKIAEKGGADGK